MAASHDGQGVIKGIHDVSRFVACGFDEALGLGALALNAGLLGLQDLLRYAAFVVELHELLLLVLEGP